MSAKERVMSSDDLEGRGAPRRTAVSADPHEPVLNDRGAIAESYHDLQGLGVLAAAREAHPLPKATAASTLRAIFQAVEIALLNLADVVGRATADIENGTSSHGVVKMFWARGFHRVLVRLSLMPNQLGLATERNTRGVLRVRESPAFQEYVDALRAFDSSALRLIHTGDFPAEMAIGERSLESAEFNLVHLARVCNQESTIWERNLAEVRVPAEVPSYAAFVVSRGMREAVYERVLKGDTYFTQFRGLHQIPEILGEEINDRLEQAIRDIRGSLLEGAIEHLMVVGSLGEGVLASLPPMVDNLATSDYHQIRENLGLTSGSHSVCLRFHMFTHLYEQLWDELSHRLTLWAEEAHPGAGVEAAIHDVAERRSDESQPWLLHTLCTQCLALRTFISLWRDEHLNLPRNNLGGESTKSLTGSPDAVQAVKHMRDAAEARDSMIPLARVRGEHGRRSEPGELTRYLESEFSLDSRLLALTGYITQHRFRDVQERLGFFANRCPFVTPARRRA
jgi:tryptophan 2,3-dioxygenase